MTKTPDDDSWLEQIRCPRYFDFEAALAVPCPSGGETNPPLRDSVYESDDETRSFFHTLETDSSLHYTPHPQDNSPPGAELRNARPIYRHRPSTSFQEYVQHFNRSQANPSGDFGPTNAIPTQPTSPCPQRKAPVTPRRNGQGKTSRISSRNDTTLGRGFQNQASEHTSPPTSKPSKANPSTPSRRQPQNSDDVTRKSAPNDSALLRRRRPPERVTPPISSVSSKSTSGGFGRNKSRKAIARSDDAEDLHGQIPSTGKRAPHVKFSPKKVERSGEKESIGRENKESDLLDVDPEILRMMEEHNRRIQQKKALDESSEVQQEVVPSKPNKVNNGVHDQSEARHGRGITVRNRRRTATDLESVLLDEKMKEKKPQEQAKTFLKKGQDQQRSEQQRNQGDLEPSTCNRNTRKNPLHAAPPIPTNGSDGALKPKSDIKDGDASLDELLQSENERVLQERKKRLPERRRALQVDKTTALNSVEGHRGEQDLPRSQARVEFTSVRQKSRLGAAALLDKDKKVETAHRNRGKENKERDRLLVTKPRKRGLKGLRERSKTGASGTKTSLLTGGPSNAQITRPTASTKLRQPYTDKIKALERQKRLERRLEEDLHELLSKHNSRVQGNRRACADDP